MNTSTMHVRFLGLSKPKPWTMGDRTGTTYKVQLAYTGGPEDDVIHFDAKVSEETYRKFLTAGLSFGDEIQLELAPKLINIDGRVILGIDVIGILVQR